MPMSLPPARRSRLVVIGLLLAGLALLAGAAWLAWRSAASPLVAPTATAAEAQGREEPSPLPSPTGRGGTRPGAAEPSPQPSPQGRGGVYLPAALSGYDGGFAAVGCNQSPLGSDAATVTGELAMWQPLVLRFAGPAAGAAGNAPNPFLDYRLTVRFIAPSGRACCSSMNRPRPSTPR